MLAVLAGVWLLLIGPFFIIGMMAAGGGMSLLALFPVVLSVTGMTFGVMLPFLVLAFGLLPLGGVAPPPILPPPVPAVPEMAAPWPAVGRRPPETIADERG